MSDAVKEAAVVDDRPVKVEVSHLTKYFGTLHVLDDVSFNIKKG